MSILALVLLGVGAVTAAAGALLPAAVLLSVAREEHRRPLSRPGPEQPPCRSGNGGCADRAGPPGHEVSQQPR